MPYAPGLRDPVSGAGQRPRSRLRFNEQPHLFHIFQEHKQWGRILGVNTVGRLNEIHRRPRGRRFRQDRRGPAREEDRPASPTRSCAPRPHQVHPHRRPFLGRARPPSPSGSCVQLRVNGLQPGLHLGGRLLRGPRPHPAGRGRRLRLRAYRGHRPRSLQRPPGTIGPRRRNRAAPVQLRGRASARSRGDTMQLHEGQILILEGIHGLNPRLTQSVPAEPQVQDLHQRADPAQPRPAQPHLHHRQPAAAPDGARQQVPRALRPHHPAHVAQRAARREDAGSSPTSRRPTSPSTRRSTTSWRC